MDSRTRVAVLVLAGVAAISTWYLNGLRPALLVLIGIPLVVELVSLVERALRTLTKQK